MSRQKKKNKRSQLSENNQSNVFTRVTKTIGSTVVEWKQRRQERKEQREEEKELLRIMTEEMKGLADRMLLIEAAERAEEKAKKLREMANEVI